MDFLNIKFANTQMTMVVFMTAVFQTAIWLFQFIYYLERKEDKKRFNYLLLVSLVLCFNIVATLLPDRSLPLHQAVQVILYYGSGVALGAYFIWYFYKELDLSGLNWFITKGLVFFLIMPFVVFNLLPYIFTGSLALLSDNVFLAPMVFCVAFLLYSIRALMMKYHSTLVNGEVEKKQLWNTMAAAYLALIGITSLPLSHVFGASQVVKHSIVNAGFLMMSLHYLRTSIYNARKEYEQLQKSQEELSRLNSNLVFEVEARAEETRKTYIALAHETKTPLTLINNYLHAYIKKHGSSDELDIIKYNLDRLTKDIINCFDNERFSVGINVYEHNEIVKFAEMVNFKIPLFQELARLKNIKLIADVDCKGYIKSNPAAIDRLLNNLIENAIKFTGNNGEIHISLLEDLNKFTLTVHDNGIGIPTGLKQKIFDKYFQVNTGKGNDGLGIGLDLVQNIVKSLNGEISIDTKQGVGTKFTIVLPRYVPGGKDEIFSQYDTLKHAVLPQNITEVFDAIEEGSTKPTLLIVDDNLSILNFLTTTLSKEYNCYVATSGEHALGRLAVLETLDLIISDVMMQGMNGFEFREKLLKTGKHMSVPFIFVTAKANDQHKLTGLSLGAIGYIEKPFVIDHLRAKIESVLSLMRKNRLNAVNEIYTKRGVSAPGALISQVNEEKIKRAKQIYKLDEKEGLVLEMMVSNVLEEDIAKNIKCNRNELNVITLMIYSKMDVNNKIEAIKAIAQA